MEAAVEATVTADVAAMKNQNRNQWTVETVTERYYRIFNSRPISERSIPLQRKMRARNFNNHLTCATARYYIEERKINISRFMTV